MFQWFSQLPPGEQVSLALLLVGWIFNLGVYAATIRYLTRQVADVKQHVSEIDTKVEGHGEKIAVLEERTKMKTGVSA